MWHWYHEAPKAVSVEIANSMAEKLFSCLSTQRSNIVIGSEHTESMLFNVCSLLFIPRRRLFYNLNKELHESYCEGKITLLLSALGDRAFLVCGQRNNRVVMTWH